MLGVSSFVYGYLEPMTIEFGRFQFPSETVAPSMPFVYHERAV